MRRFVIILLIAMTHIGIAFSQHFHPVWEGTPGVDHMNFYVMTAQINGVDMEAGDEIGIYDGSVCVGAGVLNSVLTVTNFMEIRVSRDDETSTEVDGYTVGNSASFRLWDDSRGEEVTDIVVNIASGDLIFTPSASTWLYLYGTLVVPNTSPVVSDIPDQTIAEGGSFATINLNDYVEDAETADEDILWTYSGNTDLTVSIINQVATISIPDVNWNGSETITFTATDDGSPALSDSDAATFMVTPVNDAPEVTDIPDQTITEGGSFATINLDDYVTDDETADEDILWIYSGNTDLTVSIVNQVATISIPDVNWNGSETITFTATDNDPTTPLSASDAATFTVTPVNDPPEVSDIPDQTIAEGGSFATISLDDYVTDDETADEDILWTYSGNTDLTVSIINRVATISIPDVNWNGSEAITFTATDDGSPALSDSDAATFTVTGENDPPVVSDIPDQTIAEGGSFATISLDDYVTDDETADEDILWTYSGNTDLTVSIVNRVVTITTPDADWNGSETITFTATDNDPTTPLSASDAATFTVTAVNDPPEVSDIPDQTIAEGGSFTTINLDDYVTDNETADEDILWTYSGNTDLTVSIINQVATISIPDVNWNGSETITFTATDDGSPALSDSDAATFTVTGENDPPEVSDIPDQTIAEGGSFMTINLDDYVTDNETADEDILWTYSGNTDLTVSIVNRVATITIPDVNWNGSETITFTATDDGSPALSDSDAATFTVTPVNDAPEVSDVPDQTIAEGGSFATINLDDYVTDDETDDEDILWTYSGNTDLTVSIVNQVATISIPDVNWNGSETITFTATDDGSPALSDSDAATFTITPVNDPPEVSDIPDQTIAEGGSFATINLDVYVEDVETADEDILWTYSGNTDLTVSIINQVATISIPDVNWNGSETITFTATDDGSPALSDSDAATFTVTGENDPPEVSNIPDQTIAEGGSFATINLDDYVTDNETADEDILWTYAGNTDLTVSIVNQVATISIPDVNWNGSETITFTATDDGSPALSDSDAATFTVTPVNDAPEVSDVPDQTIAEGGSFATINLDDYVTDDETADEDILWTYSGNTDLTVSIVNRVATISIPDVNWNGSETITFTATDDGSPALSGSDAATFTVTGENDAPEVSDIPDQTIAEGGSFATISLDDYVEDTETADVDMLWTYSGNTDLTVSIVNRVATISIPDVNWNGSEAITFTATDDGTPALSDSDAATFTVTAVNDAPMVSDIPDQTIAEGGSFATINLDVYVTDDETADEDILWTYSGNSDLTVSIVNRVATITIPDTDWNGSETITFMATDDDPTTPLSDSDAATFTVTPVNDAPVVSDIPDQTIAEGGTFTAISLDDYVTDEETADEDILWTYSGNTDLTVSIVNRVANITIPDVNWNGSETITFTATDDDPTTPLSGSDAATFTVTGENDPPVVSDIPDQTIAEGGSFATISLDDYVTDNETADEHMLWTYSGNTELTVSIVNRVATVNIPDVNWNGSETITFTATDDGDPALLDSDAATFTVTAVNDAPVVSDIPDQTITEGGSFAAISLDDYVTDDETADEDILWTYSGNTELTVSIVNRVATITIPDVNWNGSETITFTATDDGSPALSGSGAATFTVSGGNIPPVVSDIPDQTIAEGGSFATINLDDYVEDTETADEDILWTYSGNADLTVSIVNRVATISIPDVNWNGSETITFTATDDGDPAESDSDAATFTVTAVNDAPVVSDIPDQTIAEGGSFASINLDNYVDDAETADENIQWTYSGNTEFTVSIVNRVATITYGSNSATKCVPGEGQDYCETITFTATDDDPTTPLSDSDQATFCIMAVNTAPVVHDIPDQTIFEGGSFATINLDKYVTDNETADENIVWTYSGNTELTVSIVNRIATISYGDNSGTKCIPGDDMVLCETITFTATDDDPTTPLSDSDQATFCIKAANTAPVVKDIPDQTIYEGESFSTINLDEYVMDDETPDKNIVWTYSGNTELTVSIVNRVATISYGGTSAKKCVPVEEIELCETITFTATDDDPKTPLSDSDQATFCIKAVNTAPVVENIPDQTIPEGGSFATISLDDYVEDAETADEDILWTYAGNTDLSVSIVDRVATITTPDENWNGFEKVIFTATDDYAKVPLSVSDTVRFMVEEVNDPPEITGQLPITTPEDHTLTIQISSLEVTDVDNLQSELSVELLEGDNYSVISFNSLLPDENYNGTLSVNLRVHDLESPSNVYEAQAMVNPVNDAPSIDPIPDQVITPGSSFMDIDLDDYIEDVETSDELISWTYSGDKDLQISMVDRVVTIAAPTEDWTGSNTIVFVAMDDDQSTPLSAVDAVVFSVNTVNNPPAISGQQAISTPEDQILTIPLSSLTVTDCDNEESDLSVEILEGDHYSVVTANSLLPEENYNGNLNVNLVVKDLECSSDVFEAQVNVTPVNDAPLIGIIPDQVIYENALFTDINLDDFVEDVETSDELITWDFAENTHLQVSIVNRIASISLPGEDWFGSDTIMFLATDDDPANPLSVSVSAVFTRNSTTGISSYNMLGLKSYPNPTNGLITVELPIVISGEVQIQIFNVQGEMVMMSKRRMIDNQFRLDIQNQPYGSYFIKVIAPEGVATIKVIKL